MKNFLTVAIIAGLVAFFAAPDAERDATGEIVSEGIVDIFQIKVGDCFDDESTYNTQETVEISGVGGVPCNQPHDNEIYAQMQLGHASYPGEEAVLKAAEDYCFARFESYVGKSYDSSILDITYIYPTQQSWNQVNDREISCAVFDMNLGKLVGTTRGTRI